MMLPQKILAFLLFWFSRVLQISISYPCSYWSCSPSSDSESSSESEKQSRLYFVFNLSISSSYCCLILVMLKVSGLLACGSGLLLLIFPSFLLSFTKRTIGSPTTLFFLLPGGLLSHLGFFFSEETLLW